ncbi:hypothetical protein ACJ73_07666 [Blastomyces percursus]|uniref:Myb-like domain-containing protein n=1 Tax=Blastomyces percursus TaxID=1658174 RepID=A0A1J9R0A0_9EURO|nr:hypothetical protein ACJ73_07666 [Blastomyces percursus]
MAPIHTKFQPRNKWSSDEDVLIFKLRGCQMSWRDISKQVRRSLNSCRSRYRNLRHINPERWSAYRKVELAVLYERWKLQDI